MGFDQKSLQDEIYRRTSVRYEELSPADRRGIQTGMETGVVPAERKAVFQEALKPGGMVPVLITPENLHFFVAGGAPGCAFSFSYFRLAPLQPHRRPDEAGDRGYSDKSRRTGIKES